MRYDVKNTLKEFNESMTSIRKSVPGEYAAFISQKAALTKGGKVDEKSKWLILLAVSVAAKCPICIPKAVQHCLDAGWGKEEMLEACMVSVLVGGSSVMTYVTLADKSIDELKK